MQTGVYPDRLSSLDVKREEVEISRFVNSLSKEEQSLFNQGRRLSLTHRTHLLKHLPAQLIIDRGLIFPDDPEDDPPIAWGPELMAQGVPPSGSYRHAFRLAPILMDGWYTLDPLQLDLIAAVVRCGGSRRYHGDKTLPPSPMPKHGKKFVADPSSFLEQCQQEIKEGLRSPFSPTPPFDNCRFVAVNTVPKIRFRASPSDPTLFFPVSGVRNNVCDFSVPYLLARM